jgi:hypothetical protein
MVRDQENSCISVASNLTEILPGCDGACDYYKLHLALSIYAQESLMPITPQRGMLMESVSRQFSQARVLEGEIAEIQRRLGTPEERLDDMERANKAAHRLANMVCTALLLRDAAGKG